MRFHFISEKNEVEIISFHVTYSENEVKSLSFQYEMKFHMKFAKNRTSQRKLYNSIT